MDWLDRILMLDSDYRTRYRACQWIVGQYQADYLRYHFRPHAQLFIAGRRTLISPFCTGEEYRVSEATVWLFTRSPNRHWLEATTERMARPGSRTIKTGNSRFDDDFRLHVKDEADARRMINPAVQQKLLALAGHAPRHGPVRGHQILVSLEIRRDRLRLECQWFRTDLAPSYADFHQRISALFESVF